MGKSTGNMKILSYSLRIHDDKISLLMPRKYLKGINLIFLGFFKVSKIESHYNIAIMAWQLKGSNCLYWYVPTWMEYVIIKISIIARIGPASAFFTLAERQGLLTVFLERLENIKRWTWSKWYDSMSCVGVTIPLESLFVLELKLFDLLRVLQGFGKSKSVLKH